MPRTRFDQAVLEAATAYLHERRCVAVHIDSFLRGQWQVIVKQHPALAERREEFMRRANVAIKAALSASEEIRDLRRTPTKGRAS